MTWNEKSMNLSLLCFHSPPNRSSQCFHIIIEHTEGHNQLYLIPNEFADHPFFQSHPLWSTNSDEQGHVSTHLWQALNPQSVSGIKKPVSLPIPSISQNLFTETNLKDSCGQLGIPNHPKILCFLCHLVVSSSADSANKYILIGKTTPLTALCHLYAWIASCFKSKFLPPPPCKPQSSWLESWQSLRNKGSLVIRE